MFNHISQDKTKGILLHQLVEPGSIKGREFRRKEESICRILSEDLYPSHLEHLLYRGGIF